MTLKVLLTIYHMMSFSRTEKQLVQLYAALKSSEKRPKIFPIKLKKNTETCLGIGWLA